MHRILLVSLVVAVSAATSPIRAIAQVEAEVVGIQLVPHPDQEGMGRRGIVSIVAETGVGGVVQREVIVSNDTSERQQIEVYVGGASLEGSSFAPDDDPEHPLAQWSDVNPGQVTLDPGERSRASVEIVVPEDAAGGEHYGVVWVQPPASDGPIREINRVGVRIYLNVSDGGPASADATDFEIESMTAVRLPDGRQQVMADVRNSGERAVDLIGQLELSEGPSSLRAGPFPTDAVTTVAIGASGVVTVTLDDEVPLGPWLARLELSSGSIERVGEATITFPEEADTIAEPADSEMVEDPDAGADGNEFGNQRRVLLPLAAFLILLAILALYLMLLWKRREEEEDDDEEDEPVAAGATSAAGEDEGG